MASSGRLTKPPIKEAVVDFQAPSVGPFDQELLAPLWPQVKDRYPKLEVRNQLQLQLQAQSASGAGSSPEAHASDLGFYVLLLGSADSSRLAQFRKDGFTLSQLSDYTSADDLFDEAFDLWRLFSSLVQRAEVTRVAVRYINRLALPLEHQEDFSRYLTAPITTPAGTPQMVSEFLTRSVLAVDPEVRTSAIVTQRLEPSDGASSSFVLDLDVFRVGEFATDPDTLRPILQNLRAVKNELFFGLLTDEALAPYR